LRQCSKEKRTETGTEGLFSFITNNHLFCEAMCMPISDRAVAVLQYC